MFCYAYFLRKKINDSSAVTIKCYFVYLISSLSDLKLLKGREHVFYLFYFIQYLAQDIMLAEYLLDGYELFQFPSQTGPLKQFL